METKHLNIIIVGAAHPLRPGGITTFNERLCKALLQAGHAAAIWSFKLQYPAFLFPGTNQFTTAVAPKGIAIRSVVNSINPFNWWKVGLQLRKLRPDILIVRYWIPFMGPCLGTILRLARSNGYTKVVCIADNMIPHEKRPGDYWFTRYFVGAVDRFVVMSNQVMQDVSSFTKKPIRQLAHPLYDNFGEKIPQEVALQQLEQQFSIVVPPNARLLVFFGLVRHYKGLDLLIKAMTQLDENIYLLVAGEFYEPINGYHQQITQLGLAHRVLLHPHFIAEEAVKYFICAADAIVQPYRTATQSGVTPVAYHFEVPMIVTNVGGLPQMVPHLKAGLVCAANPTSLSAAIQQFFVLGKHHFTEGMLQIKQQLSWETFTTGML